MRILLFHSVSDTYGASRSLLRLASYLIQDGQEVLVVLPEDGPLSILLKSADIDVVHLPELMIIKRNQKRGVKNWIYRALLLPSSVIRLVQIVNSFRPDCIHTNTSLIIAPALVSKLKRIPHVWHVREIFSDFSKLWSLYQWFLYFFSDEIVCVSHAVAAQFHSFIRKRRIEVIYNGFPQSEFEEVSEQRIRAFRERFGLNGHTLVGLVGRIKIGRKGQDVFVRSAALLKGKFPGVRFLCIGSPFPGNERHLANLLSMVEELDVREQVIHTGDVDDIKAAYASLAISVVPSVLPESFSGVVVESMAMAKSVVGTSIGGTAEQIADGKTGILVPPGDAEALTQALALLLSDCELMEQMGKQGREKYLREFEFATFYEKMFRVYSKVKL